MKKIKTKSLTMKFDFIIKSPTEREKVYPRDCSHGFENQKESEKQRNDANLPSAVRQRLEPSLRNCRAAKISRFGVSDLEAGPAGVHC